MLSLVQNVKQLLPTPRYSNIIKKAYADIVDVKKKQFESTKDNEELKIALLSKLHRILNDEAIKKIIDGKYFCNFRRNEYVFLQINE